MMHAFLQIFSGNDAKKPRDYEGPREAKGIVLHLTKQAGPATLPLADAAAVTEFRKLDEDRDSAGREHTLRMTAYGRLCFDIVPFVVLVAQLSTLLKIADDHGFDALLRGITRGVNKGHREASWSSVVHPHKSW